ncbi:serine/threonine protein kinase [Mesorhizobium sp. CU2]|uniref:sensor histidine kinase n=1 Tax=unclassified Mesorhizobium TaxID=325217 RepID=UPI00112B4741|nr:MULTISPECIES: ATP-binding protein [unclassified Mesorhizobium]TPN74999.1 serine/threonine protein kinase [Mesorhizobium sp. CU3]TPO14637.1 serine/threonine protein kinase [Mesorhizobium sp. CU2]
MKLGAAGRIEKPLLWLVITALSAAIFVADTVTDLEIAFAVLYVAVVLISVRTARPGAVMLVGAVCAVLTVVSYLLTRFGDPESGLANCGLSLLAIGATTYMALRIEAANIAARQAQAELAHMSRVMLVGELGTSIAHEVSQPLAAIAANGSAAIRWLGASPPNDGEARLALERIVEAAGRAGDVVGRVRNLAARTPSSQGPVDMAELVQETLALAQGEIRSSQIALRTELADDVPMVAGDRVQLQQVILNLVVNAIDAIKAGRADERDLLVSLSTDGEKITLSVRDSGVGLAPGSSDKVFDAFYSTKPGGMGVGLAISRSIVEAHGGAVYAAPNYPNGAVFGFTLPIREAKD